MTLFPLCLIFTSLLRSPVFIRKSINLFPTVNVTWGSCGEIRIASLKSKGVSWPLTRYWDKGNCPVAELAPSPNWVPCRVLDGDTKPGLCAPGVTIETSVWSPWVGETVGSEYCWWHGGGGSRNNCWCSLLGH